MFNKGIVKTAFKAYRILPQAQRRSLFGLILLYVFTSSVQVVGLAAVLPFLNFMLDPSAIENYDFLIQTKNWLGISSSHVALLTGVGALFLFVLGLALKVFSSYWNTMFVERCMMILSGQLMNDYLCSDYLDYLKQTTAEVTQKIYGNLSIFVNSYIKSLVNLTGQSIMLIFVLCAIVLVSPVLSLCFGLIFLIFYTATYRMIRPKLRWIGREMWKSTLMRSQVVNEVVWGFKEIKILNRTHLQEDRYFNAQKRRLRVIKRKLLYSSVPTAMIQAIVMIALFAYLGGSQLLGISIASNFAMLGFFALASRQAIPAANGIFKSIQTIKTSEEISERYVEIFRKIRDAELQEDKKNKTGLLVDPEPDQGHSKLVNEKRFKGSIAFDKVTFCYPGRERAGVFDVDFTIPKNTSVAFVGATGAGKSTLADLVLGVLTPQKGCLSVDGEPVVGGRVAAWQRKIGYVPQAIYISQASVRENIALGIPEAEIDDGLVIAAAHSAQIHDFVVGELPEGYDTTLGERGMRISGGQRQRIGIARALYHQPEVVVLDEATSALDNDTESAVMEAIDAMAGQKTVILIAHRLTTVRHCDQIVVLDRGRIVDKGTFEELAATCPMFKDQLRGGSGVLGG